MFKHGDLFFEWMKALNALPNMAEGISETPLRRNRFAYTTRSTGESPCRLADK